MVPSVASQRGSRAKVERAKKHIQELEPVLKDFRDSDPYEVLRDVETEPGYLIYRLHEKVPPPKREASLIAGDVIHNLRSALDLLYGELVAAKGTPPSESDVFPICKGRKQFETGALAQVKARLSAGAFKIMKALQPYPGGHEAFVQLHELDIIDKHRLLLTTTVGVTEIVQTIPRLGGVFGDSPQIGDMKLAIKPEFRSLNDGDEITRLPTEEQHKLQFRFDVSLHEPPIVEGEPIIPFLHHLAGGVDATIDLFEPVL